jgi:hypothetical protein
VLWQVEHGWPFLEFQRNALERRVLERSPLEFVAMQLTVANPVAAPLWVGGLACLGFAPFLVRYRALAWAWLAVFLVLMASGHARSYYLGPAFPVAFAAGAVACERLARAPGARWVPWATAGVLAASLAITVPLALPLLDPEDYLAYEAAVGLRAPQEEKFEKSRLPIHVGLRLHGPAVVRSAQEVYSALAPEDRQRVGFVTDTFGSAGAINFLGPGLGLPRAVGVHNNYWLWGPGGHDGELLLFLTEEEGAQRLREHFARVERVGVVDCPYCVPFLRERAWYLCREPRRPLAEAWPTLKKYI